MGEVRAGLTLHEINDLKKNEKNQLSHSISLLYISNATAFLKDILDLIFATCTEQIIVTFSTFFEE